MGEFYDDDEMCLPKERMQSTPPWGHSWNYANLEKKYLLRLLSS